MKRRALLGALTAGLAGLAGCQGFVGGSDGRDTPYEVPPRETTTVTTTESIPGVDPSVDPEPMEQPVRRVSTQVGADRSLAIADQPLSKYPGPGRYTVGFTTPPSLTTPATLWIEFTSTADQPRVYEFGPSPPFSDFTGVRTDTDQSDSGLLLVPMDGRPFPYDDPTPGVPTNGRWVATKPLEDPKEDLESQSVELAPGESIVGKFLLLRYPETGEFPRRATYSFVNLFVEATLTISVWDPTLRIARESRFEGRSFPDLPYVESTKWYHRSGGEDGTAYLEQSREQVRLPETVLSPSFENYSPETVGAARFSLFKYRDGDWYQVAPLESRLGSPRYVPPGGSIGWVLNVDKQADVGAPTELAAGDPKTLSGLGAGIYAFGVVADGISEQRTDEAPVFLGPDAQAEDATEGSTAFGALVELLGDSVYLDRSPGSTVVDDDLEGVTLELEPPDATPLWEPSTVLYVVERSDEEVADRDLIVEQVYQTRALRNALATLDDDTKSVRVRSTEAIARRPIRAFGDGDIFRFSFRGKTYLAVAEPLDGPGE